MINSRWSAVIKEAHLSSLTECNHLEASFLRCSLGLLDCLHLSILYYFFFSLFSLLDGSLVFSLFICMLAVPLYLFDQVTISPGPFKGRRRRKPLSSTTLQGFRRRGESSNHQTTDNEHCKKNQLRGPLRALNAIEQTRNKRMTTISPSGGKA